MALHVARVSKLLMLVHGKHLKMDSFAAHWVSLNVYRSSSLAACSLCRDGTDKSAYSALKMARGAHGMASIFLRRHAAHSIHPYSPSTASAICALSLVLTS